MPTPSENMRLVEDEIQARNDELANSTGENGTLTPSTKPKGTDAPAMHSSKNAVDMLLEARKQYEPESDADRKKRERREKWQGIISGIGDAVSSFANLYFTTKGAPNAYDGTKTLSAKAQERREKAKAERDRNLQSYLNYSLKINDLEAQQAAAAYQRYKDNLTQERADAKEERETRWREWQMEKDRLTLEIRQAQIAGNLDLARQKLEELQRHNQAAESIGYTRAARSGSGGRSPGEYPWYDSDGRLHYAHSYEAMRQNALQHGTWNETTQKSISTKETLAGTETTTTEKQGKGHSSAPKTGNKKATGSASSLNRKNDASTLNRK